MKKLNLQKGNIPLLASIDLPISKSECNRLLIAQAIAKNTFQIAKLSDAEDTKLLQAALNSKSETINVGMAGTAFRFLTAYYAIQEGRTTILTGADRMKERPIGILVDALRSLGASIEYIEKEGYPPLRIVGKQLKGGQLKIDGGVSSQFISALLLIAPALETPLELEIVDLVSKPYVEITTNLMKELNVKVDQLGKVIRVNPTQYSSTKLVKADVDWSSAAFFYQLMAFSTIKELHLKELKEDSYQGDRQLVEIYKSFGIETEFTEEGAILRRSLSIEQLLKLDMIDCPDLIPSVAVTAAILSEECIISGVSTLRVKETDRVAALKQELAKINAELIELGENEIIVKKSIQLPKDVEFNTYNDHRMAMCLAPLTFLIDKVQLENPKVVEKSFPAFWQELEKCGLLLS